MLGAGGDNPNKIVYWRQMAAALDFDSQAAQFVYDGSSDYEPGTEKRNANGDVIGGGIGEYEWHMTGSGGNTQLATDRITIWRRGATDAYRFVETLHHENGHRQSIFAPGGEGGWGDPLHYDPNHDANDKDGVHDTFEQKQAAQNFGFDDAQDNGDLWEDWDHHDVPDQWGLGSGKCIRNENQVSSHILSLVSDDWSDCGHQHGK